MSTRDGSAKRSGGMRRWLLRLAILAGCIAAFYGFEHWRGQRAWMAFRAEWEARGEVFDPPKAPAVAPDQDAANAPLMQELTAIWRTHPELFVDPNLPGDRGRLHRLGRVLTLRHKRDPKRRRRTPVRVAPFAGAEWLHDGSVVLDDDEPVAIRQVIAKFEEHAETFEEIDAMLRLPYLRLPEVDDTDAASVAPPHAAALASLARAYLLRARVQLRLGNGTAPMTDIDRCLTILHWLCQAPDFSVAQGIGSLNTLYHVVADGLERQVWDAPQLSHLQRQLDAVELASTGLEVLRQLRAHDIRASTSAKQRALHNERLQIWNARMQRVFARPPRESLGYPWYEMLRPQGWRYLALRKRLAAWQRSVFTKADGTVNFDVLTANMVDAARALDATRSRDEESRFRDIVDWVRQKLGVARLRDQRRSLPELGHYTFMIEGYGIRPMVRLRLAVTAIALERFVLEHGDYPADLAQLVPDFLEAVPIDPWSTTDAALEYAVGAGGGRPAVWSIGKDRTDDRGAEDSDDLTWHYDPHRR